MKRLLTFLFIVIIDSVSTACGQTVSNSEFNQVWAHRFCLIFRIAARQNWSVKPFPLEQVFKPVKSSIKPGLSEIPAPAIWNIRYSLVYYDGTGMGESTHLHSPRTCLQDGDHSSWGHSHIDLELTSPICPRSAGRLLEAERSRRNVYLCLTM